MELERYNVRELAYGRLARVIGPSERVLFWKSPMNVTLERIDVRANPEVPPSLLRRWRAWGANRP